MRLTHTETVLAPPSLQTSGKISIFDQLAAMKSDCTFDRISTHILKDVEYREQIPFEISFGRPNPADPFTLILEKVKLGQIIESVLTTKSQIPRRILSGVITFFCQIPIRQYGYSGIIFATKPMPYKDDLYLLMMYDREGKTLVTAVELCRTLGSNSGNCIAIKHDPNLTLQPQPQLVAPP
jgi:hypothetical protein